jgi:hypothetical protein
MPEGSGSGYSAHVEEIVNYAGWLEGASAAAKDCHDLVQKWCNPPAWAYGADVPFLGDTARRMHKLASAAVDARAEELADAATVMHAMAMGLAQVAANYSGTEVQVVAHFGVVGRELNKTIAPTLPQVYDITVRPKR